MKRHRNSWLLLFFIFSVFTACGKTKSGEQSQKSAKNNAVPAYVKRNYQSMVAGYDTLKKVMPHGMQRLYGQIRHHYLAMQDEGIQKPGDRMRSMGMGKMKRMGMNLGIRRMKEMNQEMMAMNYGMQRIRELNSNRTMMGGSMMLENDDNDTTGIESSVETGDGARLFKEYCSSCHGSNGQGISGVFPPVRSSSIVAGDKSTVVKILLDGLQGDVTVGNDHYNSVMPAFGARLTDGQIADILSALRAMPGNHADKVSREEVNDIRAKDQERVNPWSPGELGLKSH